MEVGLVRRIDIDNEMQQSYLDYAMSVIVARALPDARDGLKPVHRRILHAMHLMGVRPNSPFKKSARIVGEVLGKFHPHGDMAVYDSMARMAQLFSMRYPLIEGQGNFGSVDGDPPAAMRYTEARLSPLSLEVLSEIDKDTVDFENNFDGSLREPTVLPAAFPNLLVNGATGIAVGMSTSIPPHNMTEICDALIYLLKEWKRYEKVSLDALANIIQGPDFPTGGIILKGDREDGGLLNAYGTGRGKITVRAKAHFEEMGRGRSRIIVTELPYQTNKSNLIERIADLVREGKVEGITDLRDESDRQGMRIVIELAKTANEEKVLGELFRRTPMQSTFSIIMLALVDSQPRLLNLKQALKVYLDHRLEVVRRRSEYELARAKERSHVLEGLKIALENLDQVIDLIRKSRDVEQARKNLGKTFKMSEVQVMAVLEMPLRKLSTLERKAVDTEYKRVQKSIKSLETLLASERKMLSLISAELNRIKKDYGDRRKTMIVESARNGGSATPVTTQAPSKDTWVVITKKGLISRTPTGRLPRISGRAAPALVIGARSQDNLYLFDSKGRGVALAVHTLPEVENSAEGHPIGSATPFEPGTGIVSGIAVGNSSRKKNTAGFILFATRSGVLKKSGLESFPGPSSRPFKTINISKGDHLSWTGFTNGSNEIMLLTAQGMGIRFSEDSVRPMGLSASGVKGIKLANEDKIVSMSILQPKDEVFVIASDGSAKRIPLTSFPAQGRHGKGVIVFKTRPEARLVGGFAGSAAARAGIHLKKRAARSIKLSDAVRRERASAGQALFDVVENDRVISLSPVVIRPTSTTGKSATPRKKTTGISKAATKKKTRKRPALSKKKSTPEAKSKGTSKKPSK